MPNRPVQLSAYSEVVDENRRWTPDWYGWVTEIITRIESLFALFPSDPTEDEIVTFGEDGELVGAGPLIVNEIIYLNDEAIALRGPVDNNHGMFWNGAIDGPEYRGFAGHIWKVGNVGATTVMEIDDGSLIVAGATTPLSLTAADGFIYVPVCNGVPTGTPTPRAGHAPIVIDTLNNRLYFFSNGVWRNAGP